MKEKPPPGLFITGTDTGVGKTWIGCLIAQQLAATGLRVGVYKPVETGCLQKDTLVAADARSLWRAAGQPGEEWAVCPQRFAQPLAPHLAAAEEGKRVDTKLLREGIEYWYPRSDILLVEGAGGLMSPISDDDYVADLALDLGYPILVVAPNRIGTINQTLQTLITAATFRDGLEVAGVIVNDVESHSEEDPSTQSNFRELERHCVPPILTQVSHQATEIAHVDFVSLAKHPV